MNRILKTGALFLSFILSFEFPLSVFAETKKTSVDTLDEKINKETKNDEESTDSVNIPMGEFYNVHVLGEVKKPGTYRISPSERMSDAIKRAGGVNDDGSKKMIQLRRQGITQAFDFFGYETFGWLAQNPYLLENDVIFVPLKKGEIEIEGPVKRPGAYEYTGKVSLLQAINQAGGFSSGVSPKEPIRIVRYDKNGEKEIIPVENEEKSLKKFKIEKGDYIVIPHLFLVNKKFDYNLNNIPGDNIAYPTIKANVYVVGEVNTPGPYPFVPAYTYQDYVSNAGPLGLASLRSVKVIKKDGKKISARRVKEINAGDTIFVPARSVSVERILGITAAIVGTTLSSILLYDTLKD